MLDKPVLLGHEWPQAHPTRQLQLHPILQIIRVGFRFGKVGEEIEEGLIIQRLECGRHLGTNQVLDGVVYGPHASGKPG